MIKHKASLSSVCIEEIEVSSETEHFVTYDGHNRRDKKITDYYGIFDTREQAKQWLFTKVKRDVDRCKSQLEYQTERLLKAEAL